VIAGIALHLKKTGHSALGIPKGWKGLTQPHDLVNFDDWHPEKLRQLPTVTGTILRSSRTKVDGQNIDPVMEQIQHHRLDAIVAIGGDDTLGSANNLRQKGFEAIVGVPKTIDNDVHGTDVTYGHWSAVDAAAEQVELMRNEARCMVRIAIVEIMGRQAGWLAMRGGSAGGSDIELIPEVVVDTDKVLGRLQSLFVRDEHAVVAIAEGYPLGGKETVQRDTVDAYGHKKLGGVGRSLAEIIEKELRVDTQVQTTGYTVRSKTNSLDRMFGRGLGALAAELIVQKDFGKMAGLRNGEIIPVPLEEARGGRFVPPDLYDEEEMRQKLLIRPQVKAILW
jgi:6-phosphofructokinase 1